MPDLTPEAAHLLVAIFSEREIREKDYLTAIDLENRYFFGPSIRIDILLDELNAAALLAGSEVDRKSVSDLHLNQDGTLHAIRLLLAELREPSDPNDLDAIFEQLSQMLPNKAPSSDGFVTFNHNSPEYKSVLSGLEHLQQILFEDNETGELLGEDRELAVAEVSSLIRIWKTRRIHIQRFKNLSTSSLTWVAVAAGSGVVGQVAGDLLKLILRALGF